MNLRNLPEQERPRERLINVGAEHLSLAELLAILLTSGTKVCAGTFP
jgi:DNA repair protein RadC